MSDDGAVGSKDCDTDCEQGYGQGYGPDFVRSAEEVVSVRESETIVDVEPFLVCDRMGYGYACRGCHLVFDGRDSPRNEIENGSENVKEYETENVLAAMIGGSNTSRAFESEVFVKASGSASYLTFGACWSSPRCP